MNAWLCVRLAVVVFGGVSACLAPLGPAAKPPIGWLATLIIFAFLSIVITFIFAIQAVNPWSSKTWSRPSWTANPFNFKQPFQFFHLAAYASLTQGTVPLARLLILRYPFYVEVLLPMVMGSGVLLGLQIAMLVFRSKMEPIP